ncbi:MAG: ABC transporter permease [Acholeplasmatales bacterium]|nr:ABC transporter permease [Acholeplasmatales bacterium]
MILFKKLIRTFLHYKAQFISMILMVMIGVGVYVGFNMEWKSIEIDTNEFFSETGYADFRVEANGKELTQTDLNKIVSVDGVDDATLFLKRRVKDLSSKNDSSLSLSVIKDYDKPTRLYMVDGKYDDTKAGFYISDKYLKKHKYNIGDTLKLDNGYEGEILGTCKSGEYLICVDADEGQLMPDYSTYGFVFMTPKLYESVEGYYYNQIMIESDRDEDFKRELQLSLGDTGTVTYKTQDLNYYESRGEMEEGKTMGNILPFIFLSIAVLTMITTMHRVTVNEKIQIGTLKALGFKNRKITGHYVWYGGFIALVGSILGICLGFLICHIIMNPDGMMGTYFDMPAWKKHIPWFSWLVVLAIIVILVLVGFLSVRKMLKGSAAESLRPYVPKKYKPLLIEKTKLWNKFSFQTKWNIRDIFRNKIRSIMTLVGVMGSTLLLVACFSMYESFDYYIGALGDKVMKYDTSINFDSSNASKDDVTSVINYLDSKGYKTDYSKQTSIFVDGDDELTTLTILDKSDNLYNLVNKRYKTIKNVKNDGVYVSLKVQEKGYDIGDTIEIKTLSGLDYKAKVSGVFTSYSGEMVLTTFDYANELFNTSNDVSLVNSTPDLYSMYTIYTDMDFSDVDKDAKIKELKDSSIIDYYTSKSDLMDTFDSFTEIFYIMIALFAVLSVLLALVVLYNLGVMSFFERYKQLATLKVVGFKDKHIGKILIAQNVWLTIVGIIVGIPFGILVVNIVMKMLAGDYELTIIYGWMTWLFSVVFALCTSLVISYFLSKKNKKVNMVEALKGVD